MWNEHYVSWNQRKTCYTICQIEFSYNNDDHEDLHLITRIDCKTWRKRCGFRQKNAQHIPRKVYDLKIG